MVQPLFLNKGKSPELKSLNEGQGILFRLQAVSWTFRENKGKTGQGYMRSDKVWQSRGSQRQVKPSSVYKQDPDGKFATRCAFTAKKRFWEGVL